MSPTIINTLLTNANIVEQLRQYGIIHLWLFGSYARGEQSQDSDVDLLYTIDYNKPYQGWGPISALGLLEEQLGCKVDLINIDSIHPLIEDNILVSKKQIF